MTKKIDNGRFVTTDAEARSYGETDPEDGFFYNYFTGEAIDKLAYYEDLEEQGCLVVLPCKIGTEVWSSCFTDVLDDGSEIPTKWHFCFAMLNDWGEDWHLTKEQAENALEGRRLDEE